MSTTEYSMSAYGEILTAFHQLPIKSQRAVAAVVGSMVADAATRPTHWLYDAEKMLKTIGSSNPEFWPENLSPFYTRELGKRSCYSDICFSSLQGLVTADSSEQGYRGPIVSALLNTFSPTSEYAEALERRKIAYDPSQRLTRNDPIPGPWQQKAVTTFLENHAAGLAITGSTDINESDGICCSIPVIARCAVRGISSDKDFDKTIVDIAGTLTASSVALSHATVTARVLKSLITRDQTEMDFTSLSQVILEAVKLDSSGAISAEFQTVISNAIAINSGDDLPVDTGYSPEVAAFVEAVAGMGKACGMPGSWQGALLATLTSKTFVDGVRKNIVAGGCNCSRANIAGACFGALYGIGGEKGIPLEWIEKTDKGMEAFILAMKYVA